MLVARNKESPLLHISSVILPVMWILASLIFGYNSLMAKNENYDGFKSAESNQKGILEFRKEIFNDIMNKKGSGALKSIEYIDDRELMLRHIYVSTCFRSLLKNYERFEKFKNTNINEVLHVFSLGNINRFRDQKLSNIKNDLAEDDLEFFDMMMGQKTLSACRLLNEFLYSER